MSVTITSTESTESIKASHTELAKDPNTKFVGSDAKAETQVEASGKKTDEVESGEEDHEEVESEESDGKEAPGEKTPTEKGNKNKKSTGYKKKAEKLAAENAKILADKKKAEEERDSLRQEALKARSKTDESKPAETKVESKADISKNVEGRPVAPKSTDFETYAKYQEAHDEYVDKLTDWKLEQKDKTVAKAEREKKAAQAENEQGANYTKRLDDLKKSVEDVQEVFDGVNGLPMSHAMKQGILQSDVSAELAYEMAKDPEQWTKISEMAPAQAFKAMGKIEAKIEARLDATKSAGTSTETTVQKTPKPVSPVGARNASAVVKSTADAKNFKEFMAVREKQLGA